MTMPRGRREHWFGCKTVYDGIAESEGGAALAAI